MKYTYLRKWIDLLDLYGNEFSFQKLDPSQVMYDSDVPNCDRFFIGVEKLDNNRYVIHHDRPVTEEDVCHELLHVKFPTASENKIVVLTNLFMDVSAPTRD